MTHFTLDPLVMKTWGPFLWAMFTFLLILVLSILYVIGKSYLIMGVLSRYVLWATILFGVMAWKTKKEKA